MLQGMEVAHCIVSDLVYCGDCDYFDLLDAPLANNEKLGHGKKKPAPFSAHKIGPLAAHGSAPSGFRYQCNSDHEATLSGYNFCRCHLLNRQYSSCKTKRESYLPLSAMERLDQHNNISPPFPLLICLFSATFLD